MSGKAKFWTVVYRTGGTERFEWRRTLAYRTREEADLAMRELTLAGYETLAPQDWHRSLAVGLPETFDPGPVAYHLG